MKIKYNEEFIETQDPEMQFILTQILFLFKLYSPPYIPSDQSKEIRGAIEATLELISFDKDEAKIFKEYILNYCKNFGINQQRKVMSLLDNLQTY